MLKAMGFMQPQAHKQVKLNLIDYGMNLQQALDAPRWQWIGGRKVEMEQEWPNVLVNQLLAKRHQMIVQPNSCHAALFGRSRGRYRKAHRRSDHVLLRGR